MLIFFNAILHSLSINVYPHRGTHSHKHTLQSNLERPNNKTVTSSEAGVPETTKCGAIHTIFLQAKYQSYLFKN